MSNIFSVRAHQKKRTIAYPQAEPLLPDRFRGRPEIRKTQCAAGCSICVQTCPIDAIAIGPQGPLMDLGRCLFCGDCAGVCPSQAITFSADYQLSAGKREDLVLSGEEKRLAAALQKESQRLFGRSLKLREVSAAGCNACEADVNVLTTIVYDIGRFGIQFVASPRHADGVLVTGCLSRNMLLGLQKTYEAVPEPKIVIAVGSCAISGGPFRDHPEIHNGIESILPVDLYVPGCPPHPMTILDGLLRLLGKIK